jgi:uncharacterized protein YkwD
MHIRDTRTSGNHQRRVRRYSATAIAGLAVMLGQCAPQQCAPAPPPPAAAPAGVVEQVAQATNQRRTEQGLAPLAINQAIVNAAQAHSNDQAARDTMSHTGSDGSNAGQRISRQGYTWSAWGENVAAGYTDAASVVAAWMNSPPHRDNILNSAFVEIGVGLAYAADGTPYWTQVFARPG